MAGKLKWATLGLIIGLFHYNALMAQETPQLRRLEGREAIHTNTAQTPNIISQTQKPESPDTKVVKNHEIKLASTPIVGKSARKSMADQVAAILREKTLFNTQTGIQIVDLDSGDIVYSHNADKLLKPASNTKLLTTAAAINILGADYQAETKLIAKGKIEKGILNGDLYLNIDHDFTWSTRFYDAGDVPMRGLISQLQSAGIKKINGKLIVSGYVVYGGVATGTLSTPIHLKRAGNQFAALLRKNKIGFTSLHIQQNAKADGKTLATWHSPMLSEAIVPLNRVSHNEYADMLLLAIAHKTSGKNTFEAGAKAVKKWLSDAGLPVKGIALNDGSGLSHDNRMSADFFTKLVAYMLKSPAGREWAASLSISGYDGTYGGRLATDDGKGRVYAKSGTLRDTISGSGFFINRYDGHTYAFSVIVNGMKNRKVTRQSIDRIVRVFLGNHLNAEKPSVPVMNALIKDNDNVIAKWNAVKGVEGYRIYQSTDGNVWQKLAETDNTSWSLPNESQHIRVTSVNKAGIESDPSLIFSYRPGKQIMTVIEEARCRSDEAMRPANHFIAHERPLANFVDSSWGIETVRTLGNRTIDGALFHSVTCKGSISWNDADFQKAVSNDIPVIVNVVDAHLSADASGSCAPGSGKVLGCFGEPVVTKDRRLGERKQNYRLRKAAGTGSARPSSIVSWQGGKKVLDMGPSTVAAQEKDDKKSITLIGFDAQALDSQKTQDAVWKALKLQSK